MKRIAFRWAYPTMANLAAIAGIIGLIATIASAW